MIRKRAKDVQFNQSLQLHRNNQLINKPNSGIITLINYPEKYKLKFNLVAHQLMLKRIKNVHDI